MPRKKAKASIIKDAVITKRLADLRMRHVKQTCVDMFDRRWWSYAAAHFLIRSSLVFSQVMNRSHFPLAARLLVTWGAALLCFSTSTVATY
jgi:hypothetical protein